MSTSRQDVQQQRRLEALAERFGMSPDDLPAVEREVRRRAREQKPLPPPRR